MAVASACQAAAGVAAARQALLARAKLATGSGPDSDSVSLRMSLYRPVDSAELNTVTAADLSVPNGRCKVSRAKSSAIMVRTKPIRVGGHFNTLLFAQIL